MKRAFVIQISREWKSGDPLAGTVEHVASGKTARFHSADELLEWIARTAADGVDEALGESD